MGKKRVGRAVLAAVWSLACLWMEIPARAAEDIQQAPAESTSSADTAIVSQDSAYDYSDYLEDYGGQGTDVPTLSLAADACVTADKELVTQDGMTGVRLTSDTGGAEWVVDVPVTGLYQTELVYYALEGKGKSVILSLAVDGQRPFDEAGRIELFRTYRDDGLPRRDANDNDIRPTQVEVFRWNTSPMRNRDGYYHAPYLLYLTQGTHTLSFSVVQESCLLGEIVLKAGEKPKPYAEYAAGAAEAQGWQQTWEAEQAYEKSSSLLYPTYDRSTSATSPSHPSRIRLNTIGQTNWQFPGQWISWKVTVPADGWYQIGFKARQNYQQGTRSFRTLYVDGTIPFAEAEALGFHYDLQWYQFVPSDEDGNPYLFWLTEGEHTLTLECVGGPMAEILKGLSDAVLDLNAIYRSIIMVTGTTPDIYRTFYLEDEIVGLRESLTAVKADLDTLYDRLVEMAGDGGSQAATVAQMSHMLQTFLDKPLDIPSRISSFKDNIESMGSILLELGQQPLELDTITVSAGTPMPSVKASFWADLKFQVQGFLASFYEDYSAVGDSTVGEEDLTVWISHGRDQAQILKKLIDDVFTPQTGIRINMSIVNVASGLSQSTLVQATLAGKGPDVSLFTPKDTPINLAMRGALCDLSQMEGFSALDGRFYDSAWIPYRYSGGVYAVPESQNFDMLFYRTDIFSELGLSVPQTWEEFYSCIAILQKSNLQVGVLETNSTNAGISAGIGMFDKFLLQNGGQYYTDDLKQTAFDTQVAYDAFTQWTGLYTEYGLDRTFDFYNRFRTGEMPLGIMSYTLYNQLYAAAPEIRGLWDFAPIPGTVTADGTIDRTESATGTAAIILTDAKDKEAAFRFVDWWTSAETQSSYGNELEAILGIAARYDTANVQAFENLAWSKEEAESLSEQWQSVTDIPQIPGNYFISRCLTNAFRTVVDEDTNPVRTLGSYNKDMNSEIARKRKEFHLDE